MTRSAAYRSAGAAARRAYAWTEAVLGDGKCANPGREGLTGDAGGGMMRTLHTGTCSMPFHRAFTPSTRPYRSGFRRCSNGRVAGVVAPLEAKDGR